MSETYYDHRNECNMTVCDWCRSDYDSDTRFWEGVCPGCGAETLGEFYAQTVGGKHADSVFDIPVSEMQGMAEKYGEVTEEMASAWLDGYNSAIA